MKAHIGKCQFVFKHEPELIIPARDEYFKTLFIDSACEDLHQFEKL